jgi:hypothetical protein
MNEINKNEVNFQKPVVAPKVQKTEANQVNNEAKPEVKDYKEAAAAPGAEAVGRAQVMINKADNINSDIQKILDNPKILDRADAMFNAAEKSGVPYPVAATFATQEVV